MPPDLYFSKIFFNPKVSSSISNNSSLSLEDTNIGWPPFPKYLGEVMRNPDLK